MARTFDPDILESLRREREVHVETSKGDAVHRTIIWVVVDGDDVFIRSVRGPRGRWYRELVATGSGAVVSGGRRIPVRAVVTGDAESIERCSRALRQKYRPGGSLSSMLRPETLPTTLRLEPA
jgi:hypothetical protein